MQAAFSHGADPLRAELDLRWRDYLGSGAEHPDHEEWMLRAVTEYHDEIVHFGAQLLNDCVIRPWDDANARLAHASYLETVREYDRDPDAWETTYRSALRGRLPSKLREKLERHENSGE